MLTFETRQKIFADKTVAREYLETRRWPNGPICPHCDSKKVYRIKGRVNSIRPARPGLYKCGKCRKQFTVTVGTIFEGSHIPLNKWLYAIYLMCTSKKGISANQLHRDLGLTYKSSWFMTQRIRFAMENMSKGNKLSGIVEADETYVGGKTHGKRGRGSANKTVVCSLIQRDGDARSFSIPNAKRNTLFRLLATYVNENAQIMTDNFTSYRGLDNMFAKHEVVDHKKEYVRGIVHTNFAESYFSLLKRGIFGTFHHVSTHHFQRYLHEFDFRWNSRNATDTERMGIVLRNTEGKRLMYLDS